MKFLKIDNKDIKKEHDKDMLTIHQKNTSEKYIQLLQLLQFVNKETQSVRFVCWVKFFND